MGISELALLGAYKLAQFFGRFGCGFIHFWISFLPYGCKIICKQKHSPALMGECFCNCRHYIMWVVFILPHYYLSTPRCRHLRAYMGRTSPCFRGFFLLLRVCNLLPRVNVPPPRLWLKGAVLRVDYVGSIHFTNLLKSSRFYDILLVSITDGGWENARNTIQNTAFVRAGNPCLCEDKRAFSW